MSSEYSVSIISTAKEWSSQSWGTEGYVGVCVILCLILIAISKPCVKVTSFLEVLYIRMEHIIFYYYAKIHKI